MKATTTSKQAIIGFGDGDSTAVAKSPGIIPEATSEKCATDGHYTGIAAMHTSIGSRRSR